MMTAKDFHNAAGIAARERDERLYENYKARMLYFSNLTYRISEIAIRLDTNKQLKVSFDPDNIQVGGIVRPFLSIKDKAGKELVVLQAQSGSFSTTLASNDDNGCSFALVSLEHGKKSLSKDQVDTIFSFVNERIGRVLGGAQNVVRVQDEPRPSA